MSLQTRDGIVEILNYCTVISFTIAVIATCMAALMWIKNIRK